MSRVCVDSTTISLEWTLVTMIRDISKMANENILKDNGNPKKFKRTIFFTITSIKMKTRRAVG